MTVLDDDAMRKRLPQLADEVEETKAKYRAACARRNRAVVEAVDGGMLQKAVAALVRCKPPHITRILAGVDVMPA